MEDRNDMGAEEGGDTENDVAPDDSNTGGRFIVKESRCHPLPFVKRCSTNVFSPVGILAANSLLTLPPLYLLEYSSRVSTFRHNSSERLRYFLDGKDFFMNLLWPTALIGGFLLSDLIRFWAYPSWRYHNTITDIFLGTSPNQNEVFGSQMGSDLPNEASYWPGFALLIALPILFGAANSLTRDNARLRKVRTVLGLTHSTKVPGDKAGLLANPGGLLQDDGQGNDDEILRSRFANLMLQLHEEHRKLKNRDYAWHGNAKKYIIFLSYELLKLTFLLATRYRYYRFLLNKIIGFANYFNDKHTCEEDGHTYQYFPRIQENVCEICPDWPIVYDPTDPQSCIDGLFRSASGPDELNLKIPVVTVQTQSLDEIDLSGYQWVGWTESQMARFTSELSSLSSIRLLNASRVDQNVLFPQDSKIELLSAMIKKACVGSIDFTNQGIGDLSRFVFTAFNNNTCIRDVYLPGNAVTDQGLRQFSDAVKQTQVRSVSFANDQITDEGIAYMVEHVSGSTLESVDFSQNSIFQNGLTTFGKFLSNNRNLHTVNLSNMIFSGFDFTQFGQGLRNSSVTSLSLSKCGLGDFEITTLTQYCDHVSVLDLSYNFQLTTQGSPQLMNNLAKSNVTRISFAGTPIDDATLLDIGVGLNRTMVSVIDLSANQFTNQAFIQFLTISQNSQLSCIIASNNNFGNADMQAISNILSSYKHVSCVDFSANNLTDETGALLVRSLRAKQTRSINFSNNKIGDQTAAELANLLSEGYLEHLDISFNQVSSVGMQLIGEKMPGSSLTQLFIANNPQFDAIGLLSIVENFISNFPTRELISTNSPPRDVLRWVNRDAVSVVNLTHFDGSGTNATAEVTNALCVVEAKTDLKPKKVKMDNNPLVPVGVSCIKPSARVKSRANRHAFLSAPPSNPVGFSAAVSGNLPGANVQQQPSQFNASYLLGIAVPILGLFVFVVLLYKAFASSENENSSEKPKEESNDFDEESLKLEI